MMPPVALAWVKVPVVTLPFAFAMERDAISVEPVVTLPNILIISPGGLGTVSVTSSALKVNGTPLMEQVKTPGATGAGATLISKEHSDLLPCGVNVLMPCVVGVLPAVGIRVTGFVPEAVNTP